LELNPPRAVSRNCSNDDVESLRHSFNPAGLRNNGSRKGHVYHSSIQ
jgi:hypothetical protein